MSKQVCKFDASLQAKDMEDMSKRVGRQTFAVHARCRFESNPKFRLRDISLLENVCDSNLEPSCLAQGH